MIKHKQGYIEREIILDEIRPGFLNRSPRPPWVHAEVLWRPLAGAFTKYLCRVVAKFY